MSGGSKIAFRSVVSHPRRRRGMVLILVLVIVVMVSLAGFSFVATMHNEDKATRLRGDEIQAEQLVRSGEEMIKLLLELPPETVSSAGGLADNPDLFRGVLVFQNREGPSSGRFTVISPKYENGRPAGIRYGLENESARLSLSSLLVWEQRQPGAAREALLQLPGMTEPAADAILDWMDQDGAPSAFGAEAEYYKTLDHPYAPRNGPISCLEELLLVRGVTRENLYGRDTNRNCQIEPAENASPASVEGVMPAAEWEAGLPWSQLLTVYSAERNVNPNGEPRIDLNDKDLAKLHQGLNDALGKPLADFVVAYRQFGAQKADSRENAASIGSEEFTVDTGKPAKFRIESLLDLVNVQVRIPGTNRQQDRYLASPLNDQQQDFKETMLKVFDWATDFTQPILRGRINVNLALPPVLQAVPGLDAATVQQILVSRETGREEVSENHRHPVWLLLEGLVDLERMKQLLPSLTCGGDVYRAQIVGFFDGTGPTVRADVVLDASQIPVRQLYWKDLRVLGRGYSWQTLRSEMVGETELTSRFSGLTGVRRFP